MTDSKNVEFFDPRLSRLIALFSDADEPKREAILAAVENIVGKPAKRVGKAAKKTSRPKPAKRSKRP